MTFISTGITKLNAQLGGGMKVPTVFEIYGRASTGKSCFAMMLCAEVAKTGGGSCYIDAKNSFNVKRTYEYCGKDELLLKNILVIKIKDISHLLNTLEDLLKDSKLPNLRLLIVDSVPMVFYPAVKEPCAWRQFTDAILNRMDKLSLKYGLVIILINHTVENETRTGFIAGLGKYWSDRIANKLRFNKTEEASVFDVVVEKLQGEDIVNVQPVKFKIDDNGFTEM